MATGYFEIILVRKFVSSEVVAKGSEVLEDTAATISCVVNGLTKQLDAVTWEKPSSGGVITHGTAAEDYQIAVGTYDSGSKSQTTVLTIPASANGADAGYTCVIQCDEHGKTSGGSEEKTNVNSNVFSEYLTNINFIRMFRSLILLIVKALTILHQWFV
jgi:hypothetical protein